MSRRPITVGTRAVAALAALVTLGGCSDDTAGEASGTTEDRPAATVAAAPPSSGAPVTDAPAGSAPADGTETADGVVDQLALSVEVSLGLPADQADCVAGLFIEYIGLDVLTGPDGNLTNLDALPPEVISGPAAAALVASVDACGVDPSVLG